MLYYTQALESVSLPTGMGVAGLEYSYGYSFFASVSGSGTVLLDPPSTTTLFGVEASLPPGVAPGQRDSIVNYGIFSLLRYTFVDQNLEVSVSGIYNIEPESYFGTAQLTYSDWDPHEIQIGIFMMGGKEGTLFGNFDDNDFAYIQYGASW